MNGIVQNNPANDPDKKPFSSRSRFKPNVSIFQTARFGECTPFYAAEVVPDDQKFSLRVNSDVDTMTLKSPLMSPLRMNKDYFFAPMRAILPQNSELITTNPLTGDDVDAKNVNCVIPNSCVPGIAHINATNAGRSFLGPFGLLRDSLQMAVSDDSVRRVIFAGLLSYRAGWYVFSAGSLARNLGYNWHNYYAGPARASGVAMDFDEYFDWFFGWLNRKIKSFDLSLIIGLSDSSTLTTPAFTQRSFSVDCSLGSVYAVDNQKINLRTLIYLMQQGYVPQSVENVVYEDGVSVETLTFRTDSDYPDVADFSDFAFGPWTTRQRVALVSRPNTASVGVPADNKMHNLSRIVAYQLACVQFYTTDSVDYLYNCALWHENQRTLFGYSVSSNSIPSLYFYPYNGVNKQYDSVSGYLLRYMTVSQTNPSFGATSANAFGMLISADSSTKFVARLFYWTNLLGFNRSLKFRDYFVGSKTRPLAVGDVNVQVSSGEFSVVDVTKNIMRQRFLNQVNRVGRSLKEYSRGIFGASPVYDPHEVVFLGSTTDIIGAEETQNTGSEQFTEQAKTSHFRGESSKFAFEGSFQEFGIIVGILTFDVARPYTNNMDHAIMHVDRFDMFNPYMQTIGDQAVEGCEVDGNQNGQNLGYQMRYMEYRQRVDYAAGGFLKYLPGYAFIADYRNICDVGEISVKISPDFIRSRSYEFDDLYQVLQNYSPAGYFHFIIRHDCQVTADRPMLAAPTIL